ncbi:unnamed protein product [Dibothriocephalus latus]|uniref:Uncharacterized protein n=1 Tax=Dibothriocephalus latus TaxID=60516 RepID=A0A3P7PMY9_DIBLA|nr:unnamed protein product [Dibothriocephalus latus]
MSILKPAEDDNDDNDDDDDDDDDENGDGDGENDADNVLVSKVEKTRPVVVYVFLKQARIWPCYSPQVCTIT